MPTYDVAGPCPICLAPDVRQASAEGRDAYLLRCANCGEHTLSGTAFSQLRADMIQPLQRAQRAHGVYSVPQHYTLTINDMERLATATELPGAAECIDNLLMHMARATRPGQTIELPAFAFQAAIGAVSAESAVWVLNEARSASLVDHGFKDPIERPANIRSFRLTAAGWRRHAELLRDGAGSRHAFMAMDFNNDELDEFFTHHLRPAVEQTGFELRTTDHAAKTAGLIDNRMRVELRTSRFVLCDLTHGNRGAYWEAGFAEGLGRPVIYLCRHDVLTNRSHKDHPHFDAAHQAIVAWDTTDPAPGLAELKAMIRATLPAEAQMEDRND